MNIHSDKKDRNAFEGEEDGFQIQGPKNAFQQKEALHQGHQY